MERPENTDPPTTELATDLNTSLNEPLNNMPDNQAPISAINSDVSNSPLNPANNLCNQPGQLYNTMSGHLYHAGQICIIMAGLPARGKTNRSERITRFLNWLGVRTKAFHLANYRRELLGEDYGLPSDYGSPGDNADREKVKKKCIEDITSFFLEQGGQVVVYDAVNATATERHSLQQRLKERGIESLFVESLVTDERVLARNIAEVCVTSPDYVNRDHKESIQHFLKHIESHMAYYEPIKETDLSCIKLVNDGEQCIVKNGPLGYLLNRVLMFLLNSRRRTGSLFFARAGSTDAEEYLFNGDQDLNPRGSMYAATLANTLMGYISSKHLDWNDLEVDMAQLKRVADPKIQLFAASAATTALASALPSALASSAASASTSAAPSAIQSALLSASASAVPSGAPSEAASVSNSECSSAASSAARSAAPSTPPSAPVSRRSSIIGSNGSGAPSISRAHSRVGSHGSNPSDALLYVWTSTRRKYIQTARPFREAGVPVTQKSLLNQLNAGDAAPYIKDPELLKSHFPLEYEEHMRDRYHHRFPRGESYQDVAVRLEPLIMEMERVQTNLLIVGHESVLRVLYGYVMGLSSEDIPNLHFPANQIVELVPHGYSNVVVHIPLAGVSLDGGVEFPDGVTI